ncbi:hypothetical protein [Delftia acidovorans]|jgi:hypothetical protein|uniref:hypothetical protein n=1 Tax=Delftia acidovorans TaxID=80866 RepID=UPI0025946FB3|nr:hypothetical protein [Delftia acidovorans]
MQAYATPQHMTAAAQARRRAVSGLFDRAACTLDEAMASAEAMTSAMEQEGRLLKAPLLFPQRPNDQSFAK